MKLSRKLTYLKIINNAEFPVYSYKHNFPIETNILQCEQSLNAVTPLAVLIRIADKLKVL